MTKDELKSEIAIFCAGDCFATAEPIYVRFNELTHDEIDDALEELRTIGKIDATIVRTNMIDGQVRTISHIRGR